MKQMNRGILQLVEKVANIIMYINEILIRIWYWDMIVRVVTHVLSICVDHLIYI